MPYILNALYLLLTSILSPWLLYKSLTTGKYRRGLWHKFFGLTLPEPSSSNVLIKSSFPPTAWFHGVSVGEIHLLRQVIAAFRKRHPDWRCVISTTTDTGYDEARKRFSDLEVMYWPLDFTWAVNRALRSIKPSVVILAEGELWPNFLLAAKRLAIPVAIINGRMSPRSFRRFSWLGGFPRYLFRQIDLFAVQSEAYADCYRRLGVDAGRLHVTGSVKYDGVATDQQNSKTQAMGRLLNVKPEDLIWIAGSTQPPEEEIALRIYERSKAKHPNLRLLLVPRQKDRFDEVARLLRRSGVRFVRRSDVHNAITDRDSVVLIDSIGELGALWGLADVAFVGGSLDGKRGGQNMIEPAAYGAAVLFGPHVWNFRDTAARLVEARAAVQVSNGEELADVAGNLFGNPAERGRLGRAAQRFVLSQQGATERTLDCLERLLNDGVSTEAGVFGAHRLVG
jgi:3-deoxy-D-manno-octulosonic-acid transferase